MPTNIEVYLALLIQKMTSIWGFWERANLHQECEKRSVSLALLSLSPLSDVIVLCSLGQEAKKEQENADIQVFANIKMSGFASFVNCAFHHSSAFLTQLFIAYSLKTRL